MQHVHVHVHVHAHVHVHVHVRVHVHVTLDVHGCNIRCHHRRLTIRRSPNLKVSVFFAPQSAFSRDLPS